MENWNFDMIFALLFSFQYGEKQERLLGTSCNGNHLSPGSVLEASFSSSSLDESSGKEEFQ